MTRNRILVIEDNPQNLELATDLLEAGGFRVSHARTAEAGLRLARETLPDLILMDISLPGMDGLAATKALKSSPETRDLTVIALTAHAMRGDEAIALSAGCDGYLAKPIDTRTFAATVAGFIASAGRNPTNRKATTKAIMKTEKLNIKATAAPATGCPGFVLVVDDEEQNRALLRDPLEARGYEIAEAENGEQALQKVAARAPDVILLDVMMPRMDGFEVCRRLKKGGKTASIPVLMVTALSERKDRLMGLEAGATDFLNKPVDIQDVALRVGNAVYTKHLFDRLQAEQERSERLLLNILPGPIVERMKKGELSIADYHGDVTVLLADLVGFTTLAEQIGPEQVVCFLNEIFSAFDLLVEKHGLEKIKTIGDAYMAVGGLTVPRLDHAEGIAELALDMMKQVDEFNRQYSTSFRLRIGVNSGPVVAGVIGRKKLAYDLWGTTVNLACHLESLGEPGSVLVAESTYERLKERYPFERSRGIDHKGRGEVVAYTLGCPARRRSDRLANEVSFGG